MTPVDPQAGRSLQEDVLQTLRKFEEHAWTNADPDIDPLRDLHHRIALNVASLVNDLARALGGNSPISNSEAAELQGAIGAATVANARLWDALSNWHSSRYSNSEERNRIQGLHDALVGCVTPAAHTDRWLQQLRLQPDVVEMKDRQARRTGLISIGALVASVLLLTLLTTCGQSAEEKARLRAESLLATQIATAGRLVHRSKAPDSTVLNEDSMRAQVRSLRAAHHMLADARGDLSSILVQRFVVKRGDERRRHLRLTEVGLVLGEAESVARQFGAQARPPQEEMKALLADYRHLIDSASKGLADPVLFPLGGQPDSLRWEALDSASTSLMVSAKLRRMEQLLSTHGPPEVLARLLFAVLFVVVGASLLQLLSWLFGAVDAKSQIERIIGSQASGPAATIASSLIALAPLGLAAGLATGYAVSAPATSAPTSRAEALASVVVAIDSTAAQSAKTDTVAPAVLRAIGNVELSIKALGPALISAKERIDTIEKNAR
jgi:hypothetical protein